MPKKLSRKIVETLKHEQASRKNIPSAEHEAMMAQEDRSPIEVAYERRNRDLDPQLVWRGKDVQDWSDLVVQAPPLFIQEKVHPKALIDDLLQQSKDANAETGVQADLFADFNGLPDDNARTEFYQHQANWSNRMILGDSLHVMASLAEREGLRGKVQCIYIDPPYGIKFNSNFQWSTTSRNVTDGRTAHITREPEQVKAFRDTWNDGIHSYLTYLRDRITIARDLLTESGSLFVQIGVDNAHRVRMLMDEIFGPENHVASVVFRKTTGKAGMSIDNTYDVALWFTKYKELAKLRKLYYKRRVEDDANYRFSFTESGQFVSAKESSYRIASMNPITSQSASTTTVFSFKHCGRVFRPGKGGWKTNIEGMQRLDRARRLTFSGKTLRFVRPFDDYPYQSYNDIWDDTRQSGFGDEKIYVVQTATRVAERCILMTTDPSDIVLDPTCGSGTIAYVSEQWGRRWITIDTSRVALALARQRVMCARYAYYFLADSKEGQYKEAEITGISPLEAHTHGDIRQGFIYERVPHVTLKSIVKNSNIDVIWDGYQLTLDSLRKKLNQSASKVWEEWEIPSKTQVGWSDTTRELHAQWWKQRTARQKEIDASIAADAEFEILFDKPYEDTSRVRVAGPFTVESISPHRVLGVNEDDEFIAGVAESRVGYQEKPDFATTVLDHLRSAGVQQPHIEGRISFSSVKPWPGDLVCADARYLEGDTGTDKRAAVFVGPEFGTVVRPDLVAAAREAADADFELLIACAFNYDAHASEFTRLGRVPILKARINADLHMAGDLKNTGKGNLFVVFGEPDIDIVQLKRSHDPSQIQVRINGVDVFHPNTGEVRSDGVDGIACWFIDTDYNEESFFVRHAYFLGASDPYKALKTTLKAEIDREVWSSLNSDVSRPFARPQSGRIAVKVINHLGDEVMKVFRV